MHDPVALFAEWQAFAQAHSWHRKNWAKLKPGNLAFAMGMFEAMAELSFPEFNRVWMALPLDVRRDTSNGRATEILHCFITAKNPAPRRLPVKDASGRTVGFQSSVKV